jgi:hypothetical protein
MLTAWRAAIHRAAACPLCGPSPVPSPGTRPTALRIGTGQSHRRQGAHGRRARPGTLPRLHGACRAVTRPTARSPDGRPARAHGTGNRPALRRPGPPVRCPPHGPEPRPPATRRQPPGHRPAPFSGARLATRAVGHSVGGGLGCPSWPRVRVEMGAGSGSADPVPDPRRGKDDRGIAELAAQPADGNGDRVGERVGVLVPDLLQ